jgi:hypothetical protein
MATVIQEQQSRGDLRRDAIGNALGGIIEKGAEGYQNRADEMALQKAIGGLGKDASPQDILKTITGVHTYRPESKQNMLKNYMGAAEFEEAKAKRIELENTRKLKEQQIASEKTEKKNEAAEKAVRQQNEAVTIVEQSELPREQKDALIAAAKKGELSPTSASAFASKPLDTADYKIAKNHAERFNPSIEYYNKKAIESESVIPNLEAAIINNEKYTGSEKLWDTAIDSLNSPFLNQFKSKTSQELEAIAPVALAGFSSKMGGVLTAARQRLLERKIAGTGKDKDANRMLLYVDYFDKKLDVIRSQLTNEIIGENKYGLPPSNFQEVLKEREKPYQKMINEDIGRLLDNKKPISPMSKLNIAGQMESQLQPGEVLVSDPETGEFFAIQEEKLKKPENKKYQKLRF